MSLSLLVRLLLALLVAGALGVGYFRLDPLVYADTAAETNRPAPAASRRSLVYRVAQTPITFAFSQPVTQAKLILHPAVAPAVRGKDDGFEYEVRVSWLGAAGQILAQYDVALQSDAPDIVYASHKAERFFRTGTDLVAEQDELLLESDRPALGLRIELRRGDEGIRGIDVRPFERRTDLAALSPETFHRLSNTTQEVILAPNAFPAEMLTLDEKGRLMRNQWRAVGPVGIEGRDYDMRVLYEAAGAGP